MNIYDTKQIYCARCEKSIGEIDYEAKVINSLCGQCANPLPEGDDILYSIRSQNKSQSMYQINQPILVEI